ncbi:MAG: DUF3263 domain-containing protein [Bifidobacteriaceae bacterium]|jgi:hypothetical protein|nr:DUF3263 domain-containing protein [Bifidobacteriaceae bacterium]
MRTEGAFAHQSGGVDGGTSAAPDDGLSERDRGILMFERQWWRYEGPKEQAIRNLFQVDVTAYYQILGSLIDTEEALAFDPQLVKRLRRIREDRQRSRSARRLGGPRDQPFFR